MRPLIEELRKAFVEANEMGREYKRLSENELAKCVFCDIIAHKSKAKIVHETNKVVAFLDIDPISAGHILVVPKIHTDSITKVPQEYLIEVIETARRIVEVFENDYKHLGYSIMQNGGECCDFGHFHLHVFPRVKDDGFGWTNPKKGDNTQMKLPLI